MTNRSIARAFRAIVRPIPGRQALLSALLLWISVVIAYNAHKQIVNHLSDERFSRALSADIKALMPWASLIAFGVTLGAGLATHPRGAALGRSRSLLVFALLGVGINALVFMRAPDAALTYNGALVCFALLALTGMGVTRSIPVVRGALHRVEQLSRSSRIGLAGVVGVSLLLAVAAAWSVGEGLASRRNTLHRNGHWRSAKVEPAPGAARARSLMGAISFLTSRPALSRNRLNLGAWHGFQEVWLADAIEPRSVSFEFKLPEGSYLTFLFNRRSEGYSGMRVSRRAEFPNACLNISPDGEFLEREELTAEIGSGWHRIRVQRAEDHYTVQLDEVALGTCGAVGAGPQTIGFRGSLADAYVDAVHIEPMEGSPIHESFRNERDRGWMCLVALVAVAALNAALLGIARHRLEPGLAPRVYALFSIDLVLALTGGLYLAFENFQLSRIHPDETLIFDYPVRSESADEVRDRLRRSYARPSGAYRILLLGGSQTWGSGARREEDVLAAQLQRRLEAGGRRVECIGTGVSALSSEGFLRLYESEWIGFDPRIVVVNASNNDPDPEEFAANLRRLVEIDRARGIATLFVLEANSTERPERRLLPNHAAMRRVALELDVPLVDMHAHLAHRQDDGFLWWDHVHLTSFGQRLVAEKLFEVIQPMVYGEGSDDRRDSDVTGVGASSRRPLARRSRSRSG
jgi:lysophospholipase L1-like esterase